MKICGKQIIRTANNTDKLFLCPYAYAENNDDGVFISRHDTDEGTLIENYSPEKLMNIFRELRSGMEQESFLKSLEEIMPPDAASEFAEILIQKGVIE